MPDLYTTDTSILPIPENTKRIVFTIQGAGGGGEYINRVTGNPAPGTSGGDTTFLGMTAGGGIGGGIGGRNDAGDGGIASTGNFDYSNPLSPGTVVNLNDGQRGQINGGGNSGGTTANRGNGGNGTSDEVKYTSYVSHIFQNSPPYYVGQIDNSGDIDVEVKNPSTTGAPCGTYSWSRHYLIKFKFPFDNNAYATRINNPYPTSTAAGGGFSGYAQFGSKTTDEVGVWWCKYRLSGSGTVNSFVRNFTLEVEGKRSSLKGRGGGGGAEIEGTIDRLDLSERGLLGINTELVIGIRGQENGGALSPFAADGEVGAASVYIEYETRTYINVKNNENNTIILGQSAIIEWEVTGDADWALVEPGISPQGSNFVSEVTVTPTVTTEYFIRADGVIGGFSESSVILNVIQPPTVGLDGPVESDYGNDITLSYEATQVGTSLTLRPVFYFLGGGTVTGEEYNVSLPIGDDVNGTVDYDLTPWGNSGPYQIEFNLDAVGYAGLTQSTLFTLPINIDTNPDLIIIPESEAFKDQDPVISPEEESLVEIQVTDIDIPVPVKSDYPIQVKVDNESIWRDLEQL
jgi:hypothetical protein